MMLYKEFNPNAFQFLASIGMRVPKFSEAMGKLDIGLKMGFSNLITVLFGLFSVKLINIPLYFT